MQEAVEQMGIRTIVPTDGRAQRACAAAADKPSAEQQKHSQMMCSQCDDVNHDGQLLLCDGCNKGYHTFCLQPKLKRVPVQIRSVLCSLLSVLSLLSALFSAQARASRNPNM